MKLNEISYRVIQAQHGLETIIVSSGGKEFSLHSRINPERESEIFSDKLDPDRFDVLIVLGVGLGYHLVPLSGRLNNYSRIVLIDILDGLEPAIARNRLTSFLLASDRITLLMGKSSDEAAESLSEIINLDDVKGISVLEHPASIRIFENYYRSVKSSVEKLINRMAANKATKAAFGALYLKNIIKNIGQIEGSRPVMQLFGALNQYPAIVIAPGPSLEKKIPDLKKHQSHFFIVSADSAVPVLSCFGIKSDFIISIDPQPHVYEHFIGYKSGEAIGIATLSSHPSALGRLKGYLSLNSHPLAQLADQVYGGSIGSIDSGTGSVAGDAVNLCLKCGFRSIGLVGMDFSFADYAIYARGTAYQKRYSVFFQNRLNTVESYNHRYVIKASGAVRHEGKFTRKSFLQYKRSLEDFIQNAGAANIRALGSGGLQIKGVATMNFNEFVAVECAAEINKSAVLSALTKTSRPLSSKPMISCLSDVLYTDLFREIIDASLNSGAGLGKNRFKELIESLYLS